MEIIESLTASDNLVLANQTFVGELVLDEIAECAELMELNFFDSNFIKMQFTGSSILNCTFENCDLTRTYFHKSEFRNGNFINNNLRGSSFSETEFIETRFKNNNLDLTIVYSSKIWNLNKFTEIKERSSLENFFQNTTSNN